MSTERSNIPDAALSLLNVPGELVTAPEPIDRGAIRRFAQAIMDDDPAYWDEKAARRLGHGRIVAPPLFPLNSMRRAGGSDDPFDALLDNPDYDGAGNWAALSGLPRLPLPFKRLLNGGSSVTIWALAQEGDRIALQSTYVDLQEKVGRQGPMVLSKTKREFTVHGSGKPLLTDFQVHIWR